MAHQAHALPWHSLASLLQYRFSYHVEPQRKEIVFKKRDWKDKASEPKEIAYFCRAFVGRVREFSQTERAKYDSGDIYRKRAEAWIKAPEAEGGQSRPLARPVYPDVMQNRYFGKEDRSDDDRFRNHLWGHPDLQLISTWSSRDGSRLAHADTLKLMMMEAAGAPPALSASSGPEAESLQKDVMESMLLLANHPVTGPNLVSLLHLHHGHHFGLIRVAEEGVRSYIYLNMLVAMQENGSDVCDPAKDEKGSEIPGRKNYMNLVSFERMLNSVAGNYDGDAQNLPHWDFYYRRVKGWWDYKNPKNVLADRKALAEYLKGVWRVLVIYDLVLREAGGGFGFGDAMQACYQRQLRP
ncbi:SGNH hydrolase-type esterase domain-containing protein [Apiospora arundinis]